MTETKPNIRYTCTVQFTGDYFSLLSTICVDSEDMIEGETVEDTAIALAENTLNYWYGWNVTAVSNEVCVVDVDEYEHN